jgi:hypothetical protein
MNKGTMVFDGTPVELDADRDLQERHIGVGP